MSIYIITLAALVIWTVINCSFLPHLKRGQLKETPLVSILIPLRNEANNVERLIHHLKNLTYKNAEIYLYNDNSTDDTLHLLHSFTKNDYRFNVLDGIPLQKGWVGKVHACHELSKYAKGDILIFLDADVTVHEQLIERVVYTFEKSRAHMLTGFPKFHFTNKLDRLLIPMMHFLVYVYLPIFLANKTTWPPATAANGAFIAFKHSAYRQIGGHTSVKNSLIEDIELARHVKKNQLRVLLVNIADTVTCRMYNNAKDTWFGFTKNSFRGLNNSLVAAVSYSLIVITLYVIPFLFAIVGVIFGTYIYVIPYILSALLHLVVNIYSRTNWRISFFHPISQLLFLGVIWHAAYLYKTNQRYSWKGRDYE